ncbi:putative ATP-grasp-modified RiPP [Streptomyces sp. HUAS TT20]|uniref:putative ATP-grasp-modified RiPP n=1 Tax=Streptomyces sp. HUAS TT20 TaxID=3447509 RepID=UPI0021D88E38|nr:putative ATP-grasp-modified RiPP [Streptomyces sp. HUAS 15-9]UXY33017.1 putative ATP-grasp-modified RiPP [Streptomyces sp. HUAS 15-9]
MFVHSDRLPASPAIPQGLTTVRPWGVGRMAPYPSMAPGYATATLDPETQTTVFRDPSGQVMEMPGHGTSTGTTPSTGTSPDGQGQGNTDSDTGSDGDQ